MTIKSLIDNTPSRWINRSTTLGRISYLGWCNDVTSSKDGKKILYIIMFFEIVGSPDGGRKKYKIALRVPYRRDDNFSDLFDLPLKLVASDPSFYFFQANQFKRSNNIINIPEVRKALGKAWNKPVKRYKGGEHMTKHLYRLFRFLGNNPLKKYLLKRKFIDNPSRVWDMFIQQLSKNHY